MRRRRGAAAGEKPERHSSRDRIENAPQCPKEEYDPIDSGANIARGRMLRKEAASSAFRQPLVESLSPRHMPP
jgi:hypothetical protein